MKASELRKRFLDYFAERDHRVMRCDPLVPPAEDKSLLFTGAGMNKFKNEFMGRGEPGLKRAATSQKCLRTGDMDKVGRTAYHHTFFEMLGNFSFGDYFKKDAIIWAWDFLTNVLEIPAEKLCVSVYEEDDDACAIWENEIGLDPKLIYRFGQHDNFWPADCPTEGPNGLCGPCSEIFYDRGPEIGCGRPDCDPSCDCDRFCEVWNLVFQQFERKDGGVLDPLPQKNIDTGLGLERLAAVMQGKLSNFDTDLFTPIISALEREADRSYEPVRDTREGVAFRRIADHLRAAVFCVSDGILPGNTGRGYVLRKLVRRAVLDGDRLGLKEPFLYRLVPVVVETVSDHYEELAERRENIARLLKMEEERFHQTLAQGLDKLREMMEGMRETEHSVLSGEDAFRLFDTYGLPLDVTEQLLAEENCEVDRKGFEAEMNRQREQSRKGTKIAEDIFAGGPAAMLRERHGATEFTGYTEDESDARVVGIVAGDVLAESIEEGAEAAVVLDRTCFYGEAGGEVGDSGVIESDGAVFEVRDTQRNEGLFLHVGVMKRGALSPGDTVKAKPDIERRAAIRRNHTATHLLHHALREVLGQHAEQSGSYVGSDRLRFDFTHMQAVTPRELRLIEEKVNRRILQNTEVNWRHLPIEQARAEGAIALFGEKYADTVRMLSIGDFSRELCGGLHCDATGDIGLFKITSESSVAAGIRRIEAVTGVEALKRVHAQEDVIRAASTALGAQESQLVERAEQLQKQVKELRKEVQRARQSKAPGANEYLNGAKEINGAKMIVSKVEDAAPEDLRKLCDEVRRADASVGLALGAAREGKVSLLVAFTRDLVERGCHAGKIAGEAAKLCGGGGGGRPDMAQAGGRDPAGLDAALARAEELIAKSLSGRA